MQQGANNAALPAIYDVRTEAPTNEFIFVWLRLSFAVAIIWYSRGVFKNLKEKYLWSWGIGEFHAGERF